MRTWRTVKNVVLSLFGLGVIWFAVVTFPLSIAHTGPGLSPSMTGSLRLFGWIPILLGAAVILWCYGLFIFVGDGTPWHFDPPRRLVVRGPYRVVRNPIESGALLIILGEMILLKSFALLLYLVVGYLVLYLRQVFLEEPTLRKRFGKAYEEYCELVPHYVPFTRFRPR